MAINRTFPVPKVDDDILTGEEITLIDANIENAVDKRAGQNDVVNSDLTFNGDVHLAGYAKIDGPVDFGGQGNFLGENLVMTINDGDITMGASSIEMNDGTATLANTTLLEFQSTSKAEFRSTTSLLMDLGSNLRIPSTNISTAAHSKGFYQRALKYSFHSLDGNWVVYPLSYGSISHLTASAQVLIPLPDLDNYPGATLQSVSLYYTFSNHFGNAAATPMSFRVVSQTYPGNNITGESSYTNVSGFSGQQTTTGAAAITLSANKNYYLQVIAESGTNSQTGNTLDCIFVQLTNITQVRV